MRAYCASDQRWCFVVEHGPRVRRYRRNHPAWFDQFMRRYDAGRARAEARRICEAEYAQWLADLDAESAEMARYLDWDEDYYPTDYLSRYDRFDDLYDEDWDSYVTYDGCEEWIYEKETAWQAHDSFQWYEYESEEELEALDHYERTGELLPDSPPWSLGYLLEQTLHEDRSNGAQRRSELRQGGQDRSQGESRGVRVPPRRIARRWSRYRTR